MNRHRPASLPYPFSVLHGKVKFIQRATKDEYSSSCPKCGGVPHSDGTWPDRFRIFVTGKPRGWCRRCGYLWFPDMDDDNWKPDHSLIETWNRERQQEAEKVKERVEQTLEILATEKKWAEYHRNLDESARSWWQTQGIPDAWQDFWKLGYLPDKMFEHGGEIFTTPAYTIPKWDFGWKPTNIDFRLVNVPDGVGKYRPLSGLPSAAFISNPNVRSWSECDQVFVVEGSKKAMNLAIHTGREFKQVVGLPGCSSWAGMEVALKDVNRVWVIFDPDALEWGRKFAASLGKNARLVELPTKPDDAILYYGLDERKFQLALRQATKPNLDTASEK